MFGVKAIRKICEICVVDHNDNDDLKSTIAKVLTNPFDQSVIIEEKW